MRLVHLLLWLIASQVAAANVLDFGAVANDGKDDSAAIRKTMAAGDVQFPAGKFDLHSPIVVKSGANLAGRNTTITAGNGIGGMLLVEPGAANVSLVGFRFESPGCTFVLQATDAKRLSIRACDFVGPIVRGYLLDCNGPVDVDIERCSFADTMHGVRFRGPVNGRIADCTFTDWLHYAVSIEGTDKAGPRVTVEGNAFHAPKAGKGGARQMIVLHNPAKLSNIVGARILNNRCLGPGAYYDRTSSDSPGTADQIKISYAVDFVVSGNLSSGGGENGMTVEGNCSRGIVSNNVFSEHDGHGLQVGARNNKPEPDVSDVLVTGNLCVLDLLDVVC